MGEFRLKSGDKVLFIGDSITDAGRRADAAPYGRGYVNMAVNLMVAKYPERSIEFVNRGIGGNIVFDLERRWQTDMLDEKPDWLSVMIGINDVHRCYREAEEQPDPERYAKTYEALLTAAADNVGCKMVLMEPFYLCSDPEHDVNKMLVPYFDTVHRLAEQFQAVMVPVHQAFQRALAVREDRLWSEDNVHPFPEGHALIALQWLEAMGY